MQANETGYRTFTAGAALALHARVKLSSGKVVAAVLADEDIGTIVMHPAFADGELVTVRLRNAPGTEQMIASKAITAGATVYSAAAGKVSDADATGSFRRGIALAAATGDGQIIEVLPVFSEVAETQ